VRNTCQRLACRIINAREVELMTSESARSFAPLPQETARQCCVALLSEQAYDNAVDALISNGLTEDEAQGCIARAVINGNDPIVVEQPTDQSGLRWLVLMRDPATARWYVGITPLRSPDTPALLFDDRAAAEAYTASLPAGVGYAIVDVLNNPAGRARQ
jgi:hypothetical protein